MTTSEAAKLKGVTRAAIANAIRRGAIRAKKLHTPRGPVWNIQPAALAAWTPSHPRKCHTPTPAVTAPHVQTMPLAASGGGGTSGGGKTPEKRRAVSG